MATVSFRLKSKTRRLSPVIATVSHMGKWKFELWLKHQISPKQWRQGGRGDMAQAIGGKKEALRLNIEIQSVRIALETSWEQLTNELHRHPHRDELKERIKVVLKKGKLSAKALTPRIVETETDISEIGLHNTTLSGHLFCMAKDKKGIDSYQNISKYNVAAKWVIKFTDHNPEFKDVVGEINERWLTAFAKYILYGNHGVTYKGEPKRFLNETVANHLKKIRATVREYNLPAEIPVHKVMKKFDKDAGDTSEMAFCTVEELMAIYGYEHKGGNSYFYETTRDCFVFSAFTGLRHKELFFLKKNSVQERHGIDGKYYVLVNDSTKIRGRSEVPLNDVCLEIINRWADIEFDVVFKPQIGKPIKNPNPLLPVMSNSKANITITEIMKSIGGTFLNTETKVRYSGTHRIEEDVPRYDFISFHSARHSYGCMLIDKGVDLYTVSSLMGHKNVKTTEQYYAKVRRGSAAKKALDAIGNIKSINLLQKSKIN